MCTFFISQDVNVMMTDYVRSVVWSPFSSLPICLSAFSFCEYFYMYLCLALTDLIFYLYGLLEFLSSHTVRYEIANSSNGDCWSGGTVFRKLSNCLFMKLVMSVTYSCGVSPSHQSFCNVYFRLHILNFLLLASLVLVVHGCH